LLKTIAPILAILLLLYGALTAMLYIELPDIILISKVAIVLLQLLMMVVFIRKLRQKN